MSDALDAFGRLVMENLRDKAFDDADLKRAQSVWKRSRRGVTTSQATVEHSV